MRRRDFITLAGGGAVTWPLMGRAQQQPMPVIGFLSSTTAEGYRSRTAAFRLGLQEGGFVEGRNVAIEFRWAENHYDRLPAFATDLVARRVAVIVANGAVNAAFAARAATTTIPIVFGLGSDPVQLGLVPSLARPGGNLTGVTTLSRELTAKRVELLRELLPSSGTIGLLDNPNNLNSEQTVRELQQLAQRGAWTLQVVSAATASDLDRAFAALAEAHAGGFLTSVDALFITSNEELVALASRYRIAAIYNFRDAAEIGGLMSYGSSPSDQYRIIGSYVARILKGEKPADLPVQQATRLELIINLKTARSLGVTVPLTLLGRADEVIE